ncbi:purine-nucleoside phosphorylase [Spiroplasma endosymbiont of Anurida maritima]|uniref:purine-nucleoside phosphorylase n=1 Tax=Spiroplasma endosymbiont of Anurida maritima TaxID=2967972 RepID=UPI0036D380D5
MTPHITAKKEDIAKIVIMPGDPLRAKYIAEKFLTDVKLVNEVRNMLMFTGTYKGQRITIAGSGMGCASIGIYSYELYKFYDVDTIIRVGSAGSYRKELNVFDVVLADKAYGESTYAKIATGIEGNIIDASKNIITSIKDTAKELSHVVTTGTVHSSDVFYRKNPNDWKEITTKYDALCVEMESYALYANAIALNKQAACLLTISDSFITSEKTSPEDRQNSFNNMIKLALESCAKI